MTDVLVDQPPLEISISSGLSEPPNWTNLYHLLGIEKEAVGNADLMQIASSFLSRYGDGQSYDLASCNAVLRVRRNAKGFPGYLSWSASARMSDITSLNLFPAVNFRSNTRRFTLVYFLNASISSLYPMIFSGQLRLLAKAGVAADPNFSLVLVFIGPEADSQTAVDCVVKALPGLFALSERTSKNRFELKRFDDSCYEHEGIMAAWKESKAALGPSDLIGYAHCKGISRLESRRCRDAHERAASKALLRRLYANIDIFNTFPAVNRLGCATGGAGWMWFNFWIATSTYLAQVEKPRVNTRRHYYEDWLYRKVSLSPVTAASSAPLRHDQSYSEDFGGCFSVFDVPGKFNLADPILAVQACHAAEAYISRR